MRINTAACAVAATILAAGVVLIEAPPAHAVAKDCEFHFSPTRPGVFVYSHIDGSGMAFCDEPPDEHHLILALEYKQGGRWEVASQIRDDTRPGPSGHSYQVKAACYAGSWRVAVSITGSMQGNPFVWNDATGSVDVGTNQCAARF